MMAETFDINLLYQKAGLQEVYLEHDLASTIKNYVSGKMCRASLKSAIEDGSFNLFIKGDSSTGKSTLATNLVKYSIDNFRVQSYYSNIDEFIQLYIENGFNIHPKYLQPKVLCIDDFIKLPNKLDLSVTVLKLLKFRWMEQKATIICSPCHMAELEESFGRLVVEAIVTRYTKIETGAQ